jgi:hypothetical protein
MGKRTVKESVSSNLCRSIVPERLWMSLFCSSVSYGGFRDAVAYPRKGQNHSHSIILTHGNVLIYRCKFFCTPGRTVFPSRQKSALLISKKNFDDPRLAQFQRLSTSIGRFSRISNKNGHAGLAKKTPSAPFPLTAVTDPPTEAIIVRPLPPAT